MGSEILQRQRVVRQGTERGIRVAEGEVEGSENLPLSRTAFILIIIMSNRASARIRPQERRYLVKEAENTG